MKQLRRFLGLTSGERRLLVSAIIWLVSIRLAIVMLPIRTLLRLTELSSERNHLGRDDGLPPERIAWSVQTISRYLPGTRKCLVQSLATLAMLARRGHPAHLHIGIAKDEGGRLKAHAWVECEGKIIIGSGGVSQYTTLPLLEI